jgi:class 3 adenylate cyclase
VTTLSWLALVSLLSGGGVGEYLVVKLARPLEFRAREFLGRAPSVSPQLKIFAVDDSTFGKLGTWVLSPTDWIDVLTAIAKKSPRAIFIDQLFSKGLDFLPDGTGFSKKLRELGVPVYAGAFLSPTQLRYRDEIDLSSPQFSLSAWVPGGSGDPGAADVPTLPSARQLFAYGPSLEVRQAFTGIGHLMFDGSGTISPLVLIGEGHAFPHMTTYLAKERQLRAGRLELDGQVVPLDEQGREIVNLPSVSGLHARTHSMRGLIALAQNGEPSGLVEKDDVVLILPQMYTGNTDFKQTALGNIPAGWIVATLLNSYLTREWLRPVSGEVFFSIVLTACGALLGMTLGAGVFWLSLLLLVGGVVSSSLFAFAYFSLVIPWLLPVMGCLGSAVSLFAAKSLATERKTRLLRQALEGVVPAAELKEVLKRPDRVSLEPRERVVTIMFVDVVGFSLIAERMLPRTAFDNLKHMLAGIIQTIHECGGAIDKTLGDGLLCYFGYRFDQDTTSPDHAEKALQCARKIQELNILRNIQAAENGDPVYPLRIGINTSSCYLGDLGSENRIDFTLVGNGVNFAKRLEGACEMHSVLMGATTFDLVRAMRLPEKLFLRRLIQIKHHSDLVEAYEFDPFIDQPELRAAAILGFRKCVNVERIEVRRPVPDAAMIHVSSDFGSGRLINFSQKGLALRLTQFLAKGTRLSITLDTPGGALRSQLQKDGIDVLHGEVRWGYADGDQYVHGISIGYLSDQQSRAFLQTLIEFSFAGQKIETEEGDNQRGQAA